MGKGENPRQSLGLQTLQTLQTCFSACAMNAHLHWVIAPESYIDAAPYHDVCEAGKRPGEMRERT